MRYRFQWFHTLDANVFPEREYAQLCARVPQVSPFNHLSWLRAAANALTPHQSLHVLLAWQGSELLLCLPLVRCREGTLGLHWTVLRHLGYPLTDRVALLCLLDDEGLRAARTAILQELPHALIQLHEVECTDDQQRLFEQWAAASSTCDSRACCRVPVHRISEADHKEPSGDVRYKLRRARKRCSAKGAVVRRVTPDGASIGALLETLARVETASWKGEEGVGIFSGERRQRWIFEAFGALAAAGKVRVVILELEGHCLSYRLGLFDRGRLYDYNLAFLPEYAELGIGRLLLDEWIKWGLEEGWQWIDASRVSLNHSGHQLHERMTGKVEQQRWSFYSWRPSGIVLGLAYRAWLKLKGHRQRTAAQEGQGPNKGNQPCPAE